MLSLIKIKNIALIDELSIEFGSNLNLLTGETGSGKSILVDSLGALIGERVSTDLIKEGEEKAQIEGLFSIAANSKLTEIFEESGVELENKENTELIIRREISSLGRNRIFVNNQLVTLGFLKKVGTFLGDIHGQGEQTTLFSPANHIDILDKYASLEKERAKLAEKFHQLKEVKRELENLKEDESQKLQLLDILKFQVDEINKGNIEPDEDEKLEEEKKLLSNTEKLSNLSDDSYKLLYENENAVVASLQKIELKVAELADFESRFKEYNEGLQNAKAVLEDLSFTLRDFGNSLQFSPERLEEIENRLAEISRLKKKYGGTINDVLAHLEESQKRLETIETAELKEKELIKKTVEIQKEYLNIAKDLNKKRKAAAKKLEKHVETDLKAVALDKAEFIVKFDTSNELTDDNFTVKGFEKIEFYFSANPGESPKPLSKVASGGEASRLMLILKTAVNMNDFEKTVVFDEVDAGVGGRVAEAVGKKLKQLSKTQQIICVTHQPQVAALADHHYLVEKATKSKKTFVAIRKLNKQNRVKEIARMLAGENITETAQKHAQELIKKYE